MVKRIIEKNFLPLPRVFSDLNLYSVLRKFLPVLALYRLFSVRWAPGIPPPFYLRKEKEKKEKEGVFVFCFSHVRKQRKEGGGEREMV